MNDEILKHLIDIMQTAEEIETFTRGMDFAEYKVNTVTQRAVERDFEIIGEALNRIKRIDEKYLSSNQRRKLVRKNLVPGAGFEPAHPFGYYPLKIACLPVPPPRHL